MDEAPSAPPLPPLIAHSLDLLTPYFGSYLSLPPSLHPIAISSILVLFFPLFIPILSCHVFHFLFPFFLFSISCIFALQMLGKLSAI